MLQRCAVVVSVLSVLLCASARDAPITWPDPRHFSVSVDKQWGSGLTFYWPVSMYCRQNGLLKFSVSITKVGEGKTGMNVSGTRERLYATLSRGEGDYLITAEMRTQFNAQGVAANTNITVVGSRRFGSRSPQRVKEALEVGVIGDGPFVVVLRHNATEECLLIVYGETSSESSTIEALDVCEGEKRASMAITLPIEAQPLAVSPETRLLKFDLPRDLFQSLPMFQIQAYALSARARIQLDPPCDIYGKLELTSPKTAKLIVTFRPPASHPQFIRNFTFVFSPTNEKIVFVVVSDEGPASHDGENTIRYSQLLQAQRNKTIHFEVRPKVEYKYPGNYTVTAFTNSAVSKQAIHSIIMPVFFALQPPYHETYASWDGSVTVKWDRPQLFPASCTYLVHAVPYDPNASNVTQQPQHNQQRVTFSNLQPDTKYDIQLESNCTGSEPFHTHLADVESEPGIPGVPTNIRLTQVGPKEVNFTWRAPLLLPGRYPYYYWSCKLEASKFRVREKTNDTYTVLKNAKPGGLSCTVQAVMKSKGFMDKYGKESSPVEIRVQPAGYGTTTDSSTTLSATVPAGISKGKEEVETEENGAKTTAEATSATVPRRMY